MLARAAERNPSVFLPTGPRCNLTEIVPKLLGVAEYVDNPWGNTKFLLTQFKPSPSPISNMSKNQKKEVQEAVNRSKTIGEVAEKLDCRLGHGRAVMDEIAATIRARTRKDESDIFEERREAEEAGQVLDEPAAWETEANVGGREVGVGQSQAIHA